MCVCVCVCGGGGGRGISGSVWVHGGGWSSSVFDIPWSTSSSAFVMPSRSVFFRPRFLLLLPLLLGSSVFPVLIFLLPLPPFFFFFSPVFLVVLALLLLHPAFFISSSQFSISFFILRSSVFLLGRLKNPFFPRSSLCLVVLIIFLLLPPFSRSSPFSFFFFHFSVFPVLILLLSPFFTLPSSSHSSSSSVFQSSPFSFFFFLRFSLFGLVVLNFSSSVFQSSPFSFFFFLRSSVLPVIAPLLLPPPRFFSPLVVLITLPPFFSLQSPRSSFSFSSGLRSSQITFFFIFLRFSSPLFSHFLFLPSVIQLCLPRAHSPSSVFILI